MKQFILLLLSFGLLVTASPVEEKRTPACSAGTSVVNGRSCKVTCKQDRPGGDYGNSMTGSFSACITACANDPRCLTAQYDTQNGYCYFKDTVNPFSSNKDVDTVDCGAAPTTTSSTSSTSSSTSSSASSTTSVASTTSSTSSSTTTVSTTTTSTTTASTTTACSSGSPQPTIINGRSCTVTTNIDRPGGDIPDLAKYTSSFDACISYCASLSQCVSATFHISNGYCYVKGSLTPIVVDCDDDTVDCGPVPTTTSSSTTTTTSSSTTTTTTTTTTMTTTTTKTTTTTTTTTSSAPPATSTVCSSSQESYCDGCYCNIKVEDKRTVFCADYNICGTGCQEDADCYFYGTSYACTYSQECGGTKSCSANAGNACPNPTTAKRDLERVLGNA